MRTFVGDFADALSSEIEPLLGDALVYRDVRRLDGGDILPDALAHALCNSACMIMIYTPTYFHPMHTYCAREYKAMLDLEEKRIARLPGQTERHHGLIIPVVLRGSAALPRLFRNRAYHNFAEYQLGSPRLSRHPKFTPTLRQIASYVAERYIELNQSKESTESDCDGFRLPEVSEIQDLLDDFAIPAPRFPGRIP